MNPEDPAPGASPGPNGPAGVERPTCLFKLRLAAVSRRCRRICPVCLLRKSLLRPPTPYEIGRMVRLPAKAAGLQFELERRTGRRLDESIAHRSTRFSG